MILSVHIASTEATTRDAHAVYVSYRMNESTIALPTESKFFSCSSISLHIQTEMTSINIFLFLLIQLGTC